MGDEPAGRAPGALRNDRQLRDAGNGFFFVDVDGRRIFNNQETYGFPDHEQISRGSTPCASRQPAPEDEPDRSAFPD